MDDTSPVASTSGRVNRLPEKKQQETVHSQDKSKSKKNIRKTAVTLSHFAKPTLTSRLRGELVTQKERQDDKENNIKTPFIPCGSKARNIWLNFYVYCAIIILYLSYSKGTLL